MPIMLGIAFVVAVFLPSMIIIVAQTQPLKFAAVSIKPEPFVIDRPSPSGFVCHGSHSTKRPINEYIGSFKQLVAPQGRCVGNRVRLAALIGFAYEIPPHRVLHLPDWAEPSSPENSRVSVFQVEATA